MNRLLSHRDLKRQCELNGPEQTVTFLTEALTTKKLRPEDFSIRELAEALIPDGREWVQAMDPRRGGSMTLTEAVGAVSSSAFSNITGQVIYNKILEGFTSEEFIFTKLVPTVTTQFNGERVPGIGGIGDEAQIVDEGQPYPLVGVNEDYIDTPATVKRGFIVPVTKEAIFFDRTNMLLREAGKVGEYLGLNKEKRIIDAVIDENTTAHRYKWRGTTYATYQSSTPWINLGASNALVDWTKVETLELLLAAITDPNTNEPVLIMPKHLIVTPQLVHTARRILNATLTRSGNYATSGTPIQTEAANTLDSYQIVSSRLLAARQATDTSWFLGNIPEAVNYFENFPLTVVQAPANSEAEFNRDIVMQFKASERGAAAVIQPRVLCKATA